MTADRRTDSSDRSNPATQGEKLSSLIDGELRVDEVEQACRQWRTDADLRRDWHAYHLIGDVLRSEDLSASPGGDAAFLQALRVRLAAEPVPLAPKPLPRADKPRRWLTPVAVAAGFAAVGLSVLVMKPAGMGPSGWGEPIAAVQPAGRDTLRQVGNASAPASGQALVLDGQVIRDARLDAYFEAHRGATGPMPSAVPGGALRSVEILVPQR
jgi:sigma-E factor negative regulatory protein RseA